LASFHLISVKGQLAGVSISFTYTC